MGKSAKQKPPPKPKKQVKPKKAAQAARGHW